jgi:large subunit ribosomal protein L10
MDRTQKQAFVSDLNQRLSGAQSVVVAHYRGLTVKQLTQLRRDMAAAGGEVQVSKNRLAKLAFKDTPFAGLTDLMTGPTLLAFSKDEIAPSRVSQKFADANEHLKIIGGTMSGKLLSVSEIKTISQLPSLDGIRGKLVGLLQAPAAQIARVTKAYSEKPAVQA